MEEGILNSCPGALSGPASHLFLTLINTLMTTQCAHGPNDRYPPDYGPQLRDGDEFDFIVIGAGSAGSVVANRLSENSDWKVLLVEAGTYPSLTTEIPSLAAQTHSTTEDWQYETEPSPGLRHKRKGRCPRGKGIGGSSLLNYMLYLRGHLYDYDNWAKAGNDGWDYDSVLKHFQNFEDLQHETNTRFGKGGELKISKIVTDEPITNSLLHAYQSLGYDQEYDEEHPFGFFNSYFTIGEGTRSSTGKAFLGKIKDRPNLLVVVQAQASKLLINATTLTVEGVEIRLNDKLLKIKAKKEVILSAGAINTPQILMNSGIGPTAHLRNFGIEAIKDLKVGENLQDHVLFPGLFFNLDKSAMHTKSPNETIDELYQYFMHRKGVLATAQVGTFVGFLNHKNHTEYPSLQFYHNLHYQHHLTNSLGPVAYSIMGLPDSMVRSYQSNNENNHILDLRLGVSYPKSKGKVLLRSKDPFEKPLIFSNYLTDENNEDVSTLIGGIRVVQRLMKTRQLQMLNPRLVPLDLPDCEAFTFDTNEYWECAIRNLARSINHWVGSCKMGPKSDPDAVVDSRLRVHGIEGVRVVDGSIMPTIIGTNTNGPIIMIGEKGSQMIKADWTIHHNEL